MILENYITIPDNTSALLWDMDGVLIDSLTFDYEICNQILQFHLETSVTIAPELIRELFPFDLTEFWRRLLNRLDLGGNSGEELIFSLVSAHEAARQAAQFPVQPGIIKLLTTARAKQLRLAVVSNNLTAQIHAILQASGLSQFFDVIVGNDIAYLAKKPAPDPYLWAVKQLGVHPHQCVVIEDSLLGAQAGHAAGCYTIGVATGAETFSKLAASPFVNCAYTSFAEPIIQFTPGAVTEKSIITPNDFVSHMIEHLAWRLGCSVQIHWNNSDWHSLGQALGNSLTNFARRVNSAAVIGMIDDGSAEIRITVPTADAQPLGIAGAVTLRGTSQIDIAWFLASRCEQLSSGQPLVALLEGIAAGFPLTIDITICSFEDSHHTWEGVFRSVGMALNQILRTDLSPTEKISIAPLAVNDISGARHWIIHQESPLGAELSRTTAESEVRVLLDFSRPAPPHCRFQVAASIQVAGLTDLQAEFTHHAHAQLNLEFNATRLNSSHVVMEDTGMVIGRALKTIMIQRMGHLGINGAGSSVANINDLDQSPLDVALSIEGRKFWTFVPFYTNHATFRREFIIGHTVGRGLFSEDLDDFIDGFAGGISGSIVVHIRRPISPQEGWPLIFRSLGKAVKEALTPNPARRGVPPGVKATLA